MFAGRSNVPVIKRKTGETEKNNEMILYSTAEKSRKNYSTGCGFTSVKEFMSASSLDLFISNLSVGDQHTS